MIPSTTIRELPVWWGKQRVGGLFQRDADRLDFSYDPAWITAGGNALSLSMPVGKEPFGPTAHAFFSNLLPEGDFRETIVHVLRISLQNDFGLLERIGGDCAGALSLGPAPVDDELAMACSHARDIKEVEPSALRSLARECGVSEGYFIGRVKIMAKARSYVLSQARARALALGIDETVLEPIISAVRSQWSRIAALVGVA